jgi:hypothetical protein
LDACIILQLQGIAMSEPDNSYRFAAEETTSTGRKRRKIRKGTQSCWECKRRKIRCTFATPTDVLCDGCRSRGTKCIGQDFPDETAQAGRKANRLSRMESMVAQLMQQKGDGSSDILETQGKRVENTRAEVSHYHASRLQLKPTILQASQSMQSG